jgi:tRNA U38,U39,U40 pseudouridine synthase TruA
VPKSFHATFGAKWRRYAYLLPLREAEVLAAGGEDGGNALADAAARLAVGDKAIFMPPCLLCMEITNGIHRVA